MEEKKPERTNQGARAVQAKSSPKSFLLSGKHHTAKENAEGEYQNLVQFYQNVLNGIQDGVIVTDREDLIMYVNKKAEIITGTSKDRLYKKNLFTFPPWSNAREVISIYNKVKADIKPSPYEITITDSSGETTWKNGWLIPMDMNAEFDGMICTIRDITKHKIAEESLLESESILHTIFDTSQTGIITVNSQGIITFANNRMAEMFGCALDDLLGSSYPKHVSDDAKEAGTESMNKLIAGTLDFISVERHYIRWDGSEFWGLLNGRRHLDEKGNFISLIGIIVDITERVEAERALKENEERFRQLFDNMKEGVAVYKPVGDGNNFVLVALNKAACKLCRVHKEDIIGEKVTAIYPKIKETGLFDVFQRVHASRKPEKMPLHLYQDERLSVWTENYVFSLPSGLLVDLFEDTSKQRKAEQDLIESEEKFHTIFDMVLSLVCIIDLTTKKFLTINPSFKRILGYNELELCDRSFLDFVYPEDREKTLGMIEQQLKKGTEAIHVENRFRCKNGSYRDLSWDFRSLPNINLSYGIANDITDMKRYETELIKAKERAEESDRLKSAFLANMSHEIRTPMNGILGFAEMLNNQNLTDTKRKYFTEIINNSCQQLLSIVNDILDISKIETGQMEVNRTIVVVNHLIIELLSFYNAHSEKKNLNIYAKKQLSDKESTIRTDAAKLRQILNNLLSNAMKYTDEGVIEFGYELKNNDIEFYVKDTGVGIKPEYHTVIFERFRQGESNEIVKGTGLGLAISKSFVEILGGRIWLTSQPGKGSTFFFTIPYERINHGQNAPVVRPEERPAIDATIHTLLVVEDEEVNRLYLEEILSRMHFRFLYAKNGVEAVDLCHSHPEINLVLMDMKMPEMNGYEAAKIIRELRPGLAIIAQTAYATAIEKQKAIEAGCIDYLSKPIIAGQLIHLISKYIARLEPRA